jgi:hypothetical protein
MKPPRAAMVARECCRVAYHDGNRVTHRLRVRGDKKSSKVLKYWATGPTLTGLFLWDASRDFPAITGPPAMQVHVRCNPPLNARAIAIRMQAPMKPAIK